MRLYISHGMSVWHPLRHDLEWINGHTETSEDVGMIQLGPHRNLPTEFLKDVSQHVTPATGEASKVRAHFMNCLYPD